MGRRGKGGEIDFALVLHCVLRASLMEFYGKFETHFTIFLHREEDAEPLRQWARDHAMKFLRIVLDRGVSASQPMLTRYGRGTLAEERKAAEDYCLSLVAAGFSVVRVKIEVASENCGVPETDADATSHSCDRYFEHHIKLLLEPADDAQSLAEIAEGHAAHLSRNALRVRSDNRREQFLTQRCFRVGRVEAQRRLSLLLDALAPFAHPILEIEAEYVVYDSNLALDAGWIQQEGEPQ